MSCVLTIGKFEGIHCGHKILIEEITRLAKLKGLASAVAIFEPHPFQILRDASYKPLFTMAERVYLLNQLGVDHVVPILFNAETAKKTPAEFIDEIFKLQPQEIIVGENYRWGRNREGCIQTLREMAKKFGAEVHVMPQKQQNGKDISTSRIRGLLAENKLSQAAELLGFPFFIMGEVTKGRQLGRTLGFPTLNIYPPSCKFLPENGVYETRTHINGIPMRGLTNIGVRPTVASQNERTISTISVETHVPELSIEMYGSEIKVEFSRFMRPERRFDTIEQLKAQINIDLEGLKNETSHRQF